jgi:hypothetical protein
MNARIFWKRAFYAIILASLLLSGCGMKPVVGPAETTRLPDPTTPALTDTSVPPTNTPKPTATVTLTPTPTPTRTATPDLLATIKAEETAIAEAFLKRIEPDLTNYGFTPADGHMLWTQEEPFEITVDTYGTSLFERIEGPVGDNFVLQTTITWNTTGGLAGCGLFFRMSEEDDGPSNQFEMYRLQNAPAWNISYYNRGLWERSLSNWVYTNSINDLNDEINIVTLVVNGRNIYPYINGKKQRLVEDITLKEGQFAFSATQESGVSTCVFEDTWIWAIDKKE